MLCALALAVVVACANTKSVPLASEDRGTIAAAAVVHAVVRVPEPFSVRTPGAAAAGGGGAPSGRVLWQAACETESGEAGERPTLAELEANGAALLKTMLETAGDECARQLRARLLSGSAS